MDHRIETVLVSHDGEVLVVLSTGYGRKFNIRIDAIIEGEECTAIILNPLNSILYQHGAEVE